MKAFLIAIKLTPSIGCEIRRESHPSSFHAFAAIIVSGIAKTRIKGASSVGTLYRPFADATPTERMDNEESSKRVPRNSMEMGDQKRQKRNETESASGGEVRQRQAHFLYP